MRRALLLAVVGVAGCQVVTGAVKAPPAAPAGAHSGGTLTVALAGLDGVDPLHADTPSSRLVSGLLCDTLLDVDPTTGAVVAGLAQDASFNKGLITLTLRKNLRFTDGTPLRAADVVASLSRLASPLSASPEAGLMTEVAGYTKQSTELFSPTTTLAGVSAVDTTHVQIALTQADPSFLMALTEPATAPTSSAKATADPASVTSAPDCVGPYVLDQPWTPAATALSLSRSSGYSATNVGWTSGGRGYADHVTFDVAADETAALAAVAAGTADLAQLPADGTAAPTGSVVHRSQTAAAEYVGLPFSAEGALGEPTVRRALSMALDRAAIAQDAFGSDAVASGSFLPAGVLPSGTGPQCAAAPLIPDVAGAQALLTAAEKNELAGTTLTLTVNDDTGAKAEAADIAKAWQQAFGMTVTVAAVPFQQYVQTATAGAGFTGAFRVAWSGEAAEPVATYPTAAQQLTPLFATGSGQVANWARYQDVTFTTKLADLVTASAGVDLAQRTTAATDVLCSAMPLIPVAAGQASWVFGPGITSTRPLTRTGLPILREVYRS